MSAAAVTRPSPGMSVTEQMIAKQSATAAVFESRWTLRALRRVDAELCQAIEEQLQLFHEAILTGEDEISEHGEAMCRGWQAAVVRMERAGEPDDAYQIGFDPQTGIQVAIGMQRSASARVRELHGDRVIWLTPDEVAAMFAGMQSVAQVKALWPGAEIVRAVERYPDQPAQGES